MPFISVDVDLADIETNDLLEELRDRHIEAGEDSLQEIYYALKFGQNDRAMELTRLYVCDTLGKIL